MPKRLFFLPAIAAVLTAAGAATAASEPAALAPPAEALASPGTAKPDAASADALKSEGPGDIPKDGAHQRHGAHRVPQGGVEASVRRLTKALDLDATQQIRLRELLESERQQIRQVWSSSSSAAGDRTGATLAIIESTREQIRSLLTEEQRKKYQATVPREMTAPAQTDVDYWLRLTQPAGPKADGKNPVGKND